MCGITGWVGGSIPEEAARHRLSGMCDSIVHRGPDDRGVFHAPGVALGVQRLSIVDLAGGHQPMHAAGGGISIVFNGEIYNHREIREELCRRGACFSTHSDTEVILRLYERSGLAEFHRLNGMFAIAIWDGRDDVLHLIRDRMGVKPLYWRVHGGELMFASEIKAIIAAVGCSAFAIEERAIWDYLTFRYVPGPRTVWQGVQKLPAGHRLTMRRNAAEPEIERYWDIPRPEPMPHRRDAELQAEFDALLIDSTRLRMEADVPVGVLLSGGLDSSAVAAAAKEAGYRLTTYAVAFKDSPELDERRYARKVASHLGCDHHEVVIGPGDFIDLLPDFVHLTDEPLADLASIPLYHVCKLARRDVKVVVSGEGSDEILGGYTFDAWAERWDRERAERGTIAGWVRRRLARRRGGIGSYLDLRKAPDPFVMTNLMSSEAKRNLLRNPGDWPDSLDGPRADLERFGPGDPLAQALYAYCQGWLVEDLLAKADRMSMGVSLELRTPFLDYRMVEFAARLPSRLRVGRDETGRYRTKLILRRFAERRLPPEIVNRPKQGFPVPVYDWLSGGLRDWARETLLGHEARLGAWCNAPALAQAVAAGTAQDAALDDRHRLWNLLILELWIRRWLRKKLS